MLSCFQTQENNLISIILFLNEIANEFFLPCETLHITSLIFNINFCLGVGCGEDLIFPSFSFYFRVIECEAQLVDTVFSPRLSLCQYCLLVL